MSVESSKITVTWLKPLREIERVLSSPGMPASAVSTGKVTSFSMLTGDSARSEEHTSELQSLMRISYAVFCLKKNKTRETPKRDRIHKALNTKPQLPTRIP